MGDTVFCTSLTGEELGRVRTWETHPAREADLVMASPTLNCDIPQDLLEPILLGEAAARGSTLRFSTEYLSLTQDADGVTALVHDRVTDREYRIRAKYLIGADGGRSKVAEDIGLPMEGQMDLAGSMNIVFQADLSKYVAHAPERPLLGAAARLDDRWHRPGPRAHGADVVALAHRLGLRHQPAAARAHRGDGGGHRA